MKFPLQKFKKVASDGKTTTLRHPDGHSIKILHSAVSPKMRGQLAELPMAEGGEVGPTGFPKIEVKKGQFSEDAKRLAGDKPKPQGYADGAMVIGKENLETHKQAQKKASERMQSIQQPRPSTTPAQGRSPAGGQKEEIVDPVNTAIGNARSDSEARDAKEWASYAGRQGFADGGEAQAPEQPQGPVVINIGGQGQLPPQMINPNPGSQAKAQAEAQGQPMPAQQPQMPSPENLPFGITPEMAQQAAQVQASRAPAAMSAENPQLNAPGQAPRGPQSGLSLQQPNQMVPQQGQDGLVPAQPQSPADPFGTKASSQAYETGFGTQMEGMAGEAQATGARGAQEAKILAQAADVDRKALNIFQKSSQDAMRLSNEALDAYKQGRINPEHYMENLGVGGRIATVIGLIGAGFGGPEAVARARDNINQQIDRDVHAQIANQETRKNVFTGYMHQLGNARDAADMTRVFNSNIYADKLKEAAARAQDPMAKARLMQASGQLVQQASDRLGQYAMRKSLESGVANGIIPPEHLIRAIVPKEEQAAATKALGEAQEGYKARDNALAAFDQVAKINTAGNRAMSPIQSGRQIAAITGPIVAQLSKATAGRFTEQDAGMLSPLFPQLGDDQQTLNIKRSKMAALIGEKLNFPELKKWNIDPSASSRYTNSGESKFKTAPSVRR